MVIVDLPDPDDVATAKLYSVEFYALVRNVLAAGGRTVVQAGSPYFAPKSFWCVERSMREAGLDTTPYHVDVPSFGDWGFVLADAGRSGPDLRLAPDAPGLRFLDRSVLAASTAFGRDRRRVPVEASTLIRPRILDYENSEWRNY